MTRRAFLRLLTYGSGAGMMSYGFVVESEWLTETKVDIRRLGIGKRIVQFSDLHYKGDSDYTREVFTRINAKKPDYVVFTGDLVEDGENRAKFLEALEHIKLLEAPVFGIPGNHDPHDAVSLRDFKRTFAASGGKFLFNDRVDLDGFVLHGAAHMNVFHLAETKPKILLCHYPKVAETKVPKPYDLILCGHSHGGQIRLPFYGAIYLPPGVGDYVRGFYETPAGNLYVNVGVGTFLIPARFCCRPEITEFLI